jgi:hypothetical protein
VTARLLTEMLQAEVVSLRREVTRLFFEIKRLTQ